MVVTRQKVTVKKVVVTRQKSGKKVVICARIPSTYSLCVQLAAVAASNEVKSRRNQAKLIFQVLFITIFIIFFSLNYSKNVAIVSRSSIFSTFGIHSLSHFIKSLCVIKNSKNKT